MAMCTCHFLHYLHVYINVRIKKKEHRYDFAGNDPFVFPDIVLKISPYVDENVFWNGCRNVIRKYSK
jgi:hypothetical protein